MALIRVIITSVLATVKLKAQFNSLKIYLVKKKHFLTETYHGIDIIIT